MARKAACGGRSDVAFHVISTRVILTRVFIQQISVARDALLDRQIRDNEESPGKPVSDEQDCHSGIRRKDRRSHASQTEGVAQTD
jgi:hypothetical protein